MSSLRHSVLEKAFRAKSLLNNSVLLVDTENSLESSSTANTSGTALSGISSTCARVRIQKNKKNKHKKSNISTKLVENMTPAVEDSEKENNNIYNEKEEEANSANYELGDRKAHLQKLTCQELTDIVLEYDYKYQRLLQLFAQLKEDMIELQSSLQHIEISSVKQKHQDCIYQMETEKFKLEEKIEELSTENKKLLLQIESKQEEQEILHDSFLGLSHRTVSRKQRRSIVNHTVNEIAAKNENKPKEEIYEDVILNLQDTLDFYSLLCGIAVSKDKLSDGDKLGGIEHAENDQKDHLVSYYKCQLQIPKSTFDGLSFEMSLNFETGDIVLKPANGGKDLPSLLQTGASYYADDGYLVSKELLNSVV